MCSSDLLEGHSQCLTHIALAHLQTAPLGLNVYSHVQQNHLRFYSPRFGDNVNYKPHTVDCQDIFPQNGDFFIDSGEDVYYHQRQEGGVYCVCALERTT